MQAASIKKNDHKYQALRLNIKDFYLSEETPDLDDNTKTIGFLGWVLVILPIIILQFVFSWLSNRPAGCWIPIGVTLLFGIGLLIYAANQFKALKAKEEQQENIREVLKALNRKEFDRLQPIYEKLHDCRRDDIVFLPAKMDYAPSEEMREYLRKNA